MQFNSQSYSLVFVLHANADHLLILRLSEYNFQSNLL